MDLTTPVSTILTMVDFSKGFYRIHHGHLIVELHGMGVPAWILRILVSYLTKRNLVIRYKEGTSDPADLPGGVGQGTLLGMWLFMFRMNRFSMGR